MIGCTPMADLRDERCPDCSVHPGEEHDDGCDVARCLFSGTQRLSCRGVHLHGRDVWSGRWPGEAECEEFGWWAYFVPNGNPSWRPCEPGFPGAVPDLNRLAVEARWDATARRWVAPVEEPTDG